MLDNIFGLRERNQAQDKKSLLSAFTYFMTAIAKALFMEGRLDIKLCLRSIW